MARNRNTARVDVPEVKKTDPKCKDGYKTNPLTGRCIKIGGPTDKKLTGKPKNKTDFSEQLSKKCNSSRMTQISNDETFTLIVHTGYDERLTKSAMKSDNFKQYKIKTIENVFDTFVDETGDSEDTDYIIAVSAKHSAKYKIPVDGVKETYGSLADTYPSILLDLTTVADEEIVDSHICVGNVTLAKSFDLVQALTNPGKHKGQPFFFFRCYGTESIEIKTATSGRRFIIVILSTESG